ncbi:MAG TPA: PhnD/SsuA/transferrin family substrate-binding protein [Bacteroidales bacterium]|nr:PhnD/SsuA/transferrin family substrate-binding protein [Bacteroidales bacterium]
MLKKFILYLLLIISIGCHQTDKQQKIRIATLKGPSAMGMVKMIDSLKQTKNNEIEITIYNEPIQVRKLMLEEAVDLAILPTTMGAILYNKGVNYQLAAIPVWGTLYLFGQDTTIKQWTDLKGKRVYLMAKGMTPDVLFKQLLIQHGINPEQDIQADYSFPTHIDLANAVASGQAKLGVISEPLVSLVEQKNKDVKPIFDLNEEWQKVFPDTPIAQTALLVNGNFAQNQKPLVENLMSHYQNSSKWVNENPEKAAELIVKYNILPNIKVARSSIPRSNFKFEKAKNIENEIGNYLKIFYEMNPDIIGGRMPDNNFIYR